MIVGGLRGAVAEDPLRLPVVGFEELVDLRCDVGGCVGRNGGGDGEEGWVVEEGKGGVGN